MPKLHYFITLLNSSIYKFALFFYQTTAMHNAYRLTKRIHRKSLVFSLLKRLFIIHALCILHSLSNRYYLKSSFICTRNGMRIKNCALQGGCTSENIVWNIAVSEERMLRGVELRIFSASNGSIDSLCICRSVGIGSLPPCRVWMMQWNEFVSAERIQNWTAFTMIIDGNGEFKT